MIHTNTVLVNPKPFSFHGEEAIDATTATRPPRSVMAAAKPPWILGLALGDAVSGGSKDYDIMKKLLKLVLHLFV